MRGERHSAVTKLEALSAALACVVALATTVTLIPLLRRHAMDTPNERSSHVTPTPRGGGLGVVAAVAIAFLFADPSPTRSTLLVLAAMLAMGALGFVDDLWGLPEAVRFGIQALVCGGLASVLLARPVHGWVEVTAAVVGVTFWLAAFTNAYNFMDGINGISAVTACVAAGWYLWLAHHLHLASTAVLATALLGGAIGFLPLNFPRARIFLGDVGSYGVGLLLGGIAMLCLIGGASFLQALAPLLVYVADTGWTLLRRMANRERWWKAHREHIYQRLSGLGANPAVVTVLIGVLSILNCLASAPGVPIGLSIVGVVLILGAYLASPNLKVWGRA